MTTLPEIRIGDPIRHESLTIFPLFLQTIGTLDYLLADEAIAGGTLTIEEVGESGSVPELIVNNLGTTRVLFLEGEEFKGAKQNRVLNTTVLVAAGTKTKIPVSCVEQGRWRYRTRQFEPSGSHSSPKLRHVLKSSVSESAASGGTHRSNQSAVWNEVSRQMKSLDAISPTMAMADTYDAYQSRRDEYQARIGYAEGASGLAVAVGSTIVAMDLFDKPSTCRKAWDRLLTGLVMEALESKTVEIPPGMSEIAVFLEQLRRAPWKQAPAVGEGEEYRSLPQASTQASALIFDGSMLHGSAVAAS